MHDRMRWLAVLTALAVVVGCRKNEASLPPSEPIAADKLRETDVLPHLEGAVVPGRNYLDCANLPTCLESVAKRCFQGADPAVRLAADGQRPRSRRQTQREHPPAGVGPSRPAWSRTG